MDQFKDLTSKMWGCGASDQVRSNTGCYLLKLQDYQTCYPKYSPINYPYSGCKNVGHAADAPGMWRSLANASAYCDNARTRKTFNLSAMTVCSNSLWTFNFRSFRYMPSVKGLPGLDDMGGWMVEDFGAAFSAL